MAAHRWLGLSHLFLLVGCSKCGWSQQFLVGSVLLGWASVIAVAAVGHLVIMLRLFLSDPSPIIGNACQ